MDNPRESGMRPDQYLNHRQQLAAAGINPKTLNNGLGYVNCVFNELLRTQQTIYRVLMASVRPIKLRERELPFLTFEHTRELLIFLSMLPIVRKFYLLRVGVLLLVIFG